MTPTPCNCLYAVCMRGHLRPGVCCAFNYPGGAVDRTLMWALHCCGNVVEAGQVPTGTGYLCQFCGSPMDTK